MALLRELLALTAVVAFAATVIAGAESSVDRQLPHSPRYDLAQVFP